VGGLGSINRRLLRLERLSAMQPCRWCEQAYWSMVSTKSAVGPYCKTEYGNEASLVFVRTLSELFRVGEDRNDPNHLSHLPTCELDREHEGVTAAWRRVAQSRPPKPGCECIEEWMFTRSVQARVLYHYPRVAEALIEALERYAASPFNPRALYHFGGGGKECVCTPEEVKNGY
jgi:hypothetical protein